MTAAPTIWVDSDACPVRMRDMIARAAHRRQINAVFVANKPVPVLQSPFVSMVQVAAGPDIADAYIAENAVAGDLVITQDIPLASDVFRKGAAVISPRGFVFTEDNVADQLSKRDLMTELRDTGAITSYTRPLDETTIRKFASAFEAAVHRLSQNKKT
jgi:uncharacterized protein YaiI (UPF0178 family)